MNSVADRFWSKVDKSGHCWLWTASCTPRGYGSFWFEGRLMPAHVWSWEQVFGPVPEGLQLDHVYDWGCRHRHCVNPSHLQPVTSVENTRRGHASRNSDVQCRHGHRRDETNTRYRANGDVLCLDCKRIRDAARRARRGAVA